MTTTNEIADKIAAEHSLTKAQGKAIVEAVIASITEAATCRQRDRPSPVSASSR